MNKDRFILDWAPLPGSSALDSEKAPFTIRPNALKLGSSTVRDPRISARYDSHFKLLLEYREPASLTKGLSEIFSEIEVATLISESANEIGLLTIQKSFGPDEELTFSFVPQNSPCRFHYQAKAVTSYASVVNGPDLVRKAAELQFRHGEYLVTLRDHEKTYELRKRRRELRHDLIETSFLEISHKSGEPLEPDRIFDISRLFGLFLTFVRGASVGIGHIIGETAENKLAFADLGFSKCDVFECAPNWFTLEHVSLLPRIFSLFSRASKSSDDGEAITIAIEFYRSSTAIRDTSLEMAIVASHAALETLVPHILRSRAGWSEELLGSKGTFHSKLRACAAFVGLKSDPLEHAPNISNKAKSFNDADGFEMSSVFRNRIVHQGKDFAYSGIELLEIWEMQQWLTELLIFFLLGYRGTMQDRRNYRRWRGDVVEIPLS